MIIHIVAAQDCGQAGQAQQRRGGRAAEPCQELAAARANQQD